MSLIASGSYTGSPDPHLIFSNIIYGGILNAFYNLFPKIEWYTYFQIIFLWFSVSLHTKEILSLNISKFLKGTFLFLSISIFVSIIIKLQFTYTAGYIAITGVMLFNDKNSNLKLALGIFLIFWSSLIRYEAALLVILISSPITLLDVNKLYDILRSRIIKVGMISVLFVGLGIVIDKKIYESDPEWNYFLKYNKARHKLNDYPILVKEGDLHSDIVSYNDFLLFNRSLVDTNHFNLSVLDGLNSEIRTLPIKDKIYNVKLLFKPYYLLWLCVSLIIILIISKSESNSKKYIPLLSFLVMFLGLIYLSYSLILKNRVFQTAISAFLLIIPFCFQKIKLPKKYNFIIGSCVVILGIILFIRTFYRYDGNKFPVQFAKQTKLINNYLENSSNQFINYSTSFPFEYVNPFRISEQKLFRNMNLSGWLSYAPLNKNKFGSFKFFLNGNGLYVTKNAYESVVFVVTKSIKSHYGISVKAKIMLENDLDYIIEFVPE
ncbi:MAG: hypothetical protein ACPGSD_10915 [Flavobacteriales bacterium]